MLITPDPGANTARTGGDDCGLGIKVKATILAKSPIVEVSLRDKSPHYHRCAATDEYELYLYYYLSIEFSMSNEFHLIIQDMLVENLDQFWNEDLWMEFGSDLDDSSGADHELQ
jgi:hypothetical protein